MININKDTKFNINTNYLYDDFYENDEVIFDDQCADYSWFDNDTEEHYDIYCTVDTAVENLDDMNFRGTTNRCNKSRTFASIRNHIFTRDTFL